MFVSHKKIIIFSGSSENCSDYSHVDETFSELKL